MIRIARSALRKILKVAACRTHDAGRFVCSKANRAMAVATRAFELLLLPASGSALPNDSREGVVGMNALLVYGLHRRMPSNVAVSSFNSNCDVTHEVFDKYGIIVSLHGDMAFVRALEQGVHGR